MSLKAVSRIIPLWTFGALLFAGAVNSIFPGPLGFAVCVSGIFFALIKGVVYVVKAIITLFRRNWRQSAMRLVTALLSVVAIPATVFAGDYVHLAIFYPFYSHTIGDDTKVRTFAWGDAAVSSLDGTRSRILVFDPGGTFKDSSAEPALKFSKTHLVGPWYVEEASSF